MRVFGLGPDGTRVLYSSGVQYDWAHLCQGYKEGPIRGLMVYQFCLLGPASGITKCHRPKISIHWHRDFFLAVLFSASEF